MDRVPDAPGARLGSRGTVRQGQQRAVWRVEVANGRQAVDEDLAHSHEVGEDGGGALHGKAAVAHERGRRWMQRLLRRRPGISTGAGFNALSVLISMRITGWLAGMHATGFGVLQEAG